MWIPGNFAKAVEESNEQSQSGISEVLKKLEMLEQRLEEVQLGKSEPSRRIPKLSHKELSILMEMDHKPQWVCRLLVFFKAVLDGQKVDPLLMECTSAWKSSDLQEELVMSPEKAQSKEVWTSGAWLESVTAPMDGSDGGGTPPDSGLGGQLRGGTMDPAGIGDGDVRRIIPSVHRRWVWGRDPKGSGRAARKFWGHYGPCGGSPSPSG